MSQKKHNVKTIQDFTFTNTTASVIRVANENVPKQIEINIGKNKIFFNIVIKS